MVQYRRNFLPGASYRFTGALLNLISSLLIEHIAILRNALQSVCAQRPFILDAVVVLLVPRMVQWTSSSFHWFVRQVIYPVDRGGKEAGSGGFCE